MMDIIDELQSSIEFTRDHGDTDGRTSQVMERAIAEITRLRSLAGAVSDGQSLADIKSNRHGVSG